MVKLLKSDFFLLFLCETATHSISTQNSQEFWSTLPFGANYEVNILASPNDYECTDMLKKGTLQNNQEVKIDFICTKIMKTYENSATSRKGNLVIFKNKNFFFFHFFQI